MKRVRVLYLAALIPLWALLAFSPANREGPAYRVPYRLSETMHMIVRAKLNGTGPFNFIVDTGAPAMFVTTDVAKKVGVESGEDGWATFDRMELEGGAKLEAVQARVEDIFQIRGMNGLNLPGVRLDGVLGYNVLARFRMDFDLSKLSMTWTKLDFDPPLPVRLGGGGSAPPELQAMGGLAQGFGALMGRKQWQPPAPRGFLGIELTERNDAVLIAAVLPEGPAALAGLRPDDRVDEFAGQPVSKASDLIRLAGSVAVGDEVAMRITRAGESMELTVKAGEGF